MSNKTVAALALLILSPLLVYFLWPTDENRIKKFFREGAKAIEEENVEDVLSRVSFNYRDDNGLTYLLLKKSMERMFQQMSGIKIEYQIREINIKDKEAAADLDVRIIATYGQETGYAIGDAARPARMRFSLEKKPAGWLVSSTEGMPVQF
jgi:hypothetical protein